MLPDRKGGLMHLPFRKCVLGYAFKPLLGNTKCASALYHETLVYCENIAAKVQLGKH